MLGVVDIPDLVLFVLVAGLSTNRVAVTITYVKLGFERLSVNVLFRLLVVATVVW